MSTSPDSIPAVEPAGESIPRSRRAILGAGLGALIATVTSAFGRPQSSNAAAGSALIVGNQANNSGTADTQLIANSSVIAFKLLQQGPGTALMGHATQTSGGTRGVYGRTDSPAGYGVQARAAGAAGTGAALQAIGVNNTGLDVSTDNAARFGIKVVNTSTTGTALRAEGKNALVGISDGAGYPAIYGENMATDGSSWGVFGRTHANNSAGVEGESAVGNVVGNGVRGRSYGLGGAGVQGVNNSASVNAYGVHGYAPAGYGVYSTGDTVITGDLFVSGSKAGYVVDVAINGSADTLRQGDPVTLLGVRAPVVGAIPLLEVGRATAGSPVIGVMDRRVAVTPSGRPDSAANHVKGAGTAAKSGDHLLVVTLGAFAVASADAEDGEIAPGTRLAAGKNGRLVRARPVDVGGRTVFPAGENVGYALGSLAAGSGKVAIFVNPH